MDVSLLYQIFAIILTIKISLIFGQFNLFHNGKVASRQPWNLSPSARCKQIFQWKIYNLCLKNSKMIGMHLIFSDS